MLNIEIRSVVNSLVEKFLRGAGREHEALYFNVDCRMSVHDNDNSLDTSCGLHLLYWVMPQLNYISVFGGVTDNCFERISGVSSWEHLSTHDSGWRDIRLFSEVYFSMAEEINTQRVSDGLNEMAPKDMHQWSHFEKIADWVPVTVSKDPTCPNNYRRLVRLT